MKCDHHAPNNEFLDSLSSHIFLPDIIQPIRVTSNSGNLTATVYDHHLPQLVIASNIFSNSPLGKKSNVYERKWTNFDGENFILDYLEEDWNSSTKKEQVSVNLSFQSFLRKLNFILDKYASLKKVSKNKLKFKSKPWITSGIQKSISVKSKLLSKLKKLKDADL